MRVNSPILPGVLPDPVGSHLESKAHRNSGSVEWAQLGEPMSMKTCYHVSCTLALCPHMGHKAEV